VVPLADLQVSWPLKNTSAQTQLAIHVPSHLQLPLVDLISFWFLVFYAATQLATPLHQRRIQVVRSNKVARKRLTESNGTPAMDFGCEETCKRRYTKTKNSDVILIWRLYFLRVEPGISRSLVEVLANWANLISDLMEVWSNRLVLEV